MKTYICANCWLDKPCVLSVDDDYIKPEHCPYEHDEEPDWQETYGFDAEYSEWVI